LTLLFLVPPVEPAVRYLPESLSRVPDQELRNLGQCCSDQALTCGVREL
jgi:hypothetical protein